MDVNYIIIKLAFYWPSIFLKSENPSKAFEIVAISSSLSTSKLKKIKIRLVYYWFLHIGLKILIEYCFYVMEYCCLYSLIFKTQFKVLNNYFYKKI